jgi:hypothetical protein
MKLNYFVTFAMVAILQCSCATEVASAKKWISSPSGKATLGIVAAAATAFAPQYAGVIGLGLNSLQAAAGVPTPMPTTAQLQSTIASVTGNSATATKVVGLASAVLQAVQNAPTPAIGLAQSAVVVNATAN